MYKFSNSSLKKLESADQDLQIVFKESLRRSQVDFGISEGHRSVERQQKLYAQGRSEPGPVVTNVDGVKVKSKHNLKPSRAVDIYAFVNGSANWSEMYLAYLGGVITAVSDELYECGEISQPVRWGGNWDGDGVLKTDQSLVDFPHYEI